MDKNVKNAVAQVVEILINNNAKTAVKYLGEKFVVRASRKLFNKKIYKQSKPEILLTIGKPNFEQREFIKKCKKAGIKFPLSKIQIKFPCK